MQTLIYNARVLTMDQELTEYYPGYVIIAEDKILDVGFQNELLPYWKELIDKVSDDETSPIRLVDAQDGIVMPGMVNAHTHVGMIPFRSLADDVKDRLRRFLFPLEAHMSEALVRASAQYSIAEMLLAGITTFADMYYFEDAIAEVTKEMGVRALLGETIINHPTCDGDEEPFYGLKMAPAFLEKWQGHSLVQPMLAPHAPNTNDATSLKTIKRLSEQYQVPVMMHVAEMDYEMSYFADEFGLTPIEYLNQVGLLNQYLLAVHCIHLSEKDITLMRDNQVKVVHCIGANTKSAKGFMPLKQLLAAGVPVGLGTDGPSSGNTLDLFHQMRYIAYSHKTVNQDRSAFPAREIVQLATNGGAAVLGLADKIGRLEPGYQADIVLIETQSVNMYPVFDPYSVLVYSANAANVTDVWVAGQHLVENKQLTKVELEEVRHELETNMAVFKEEVQKIEAQGNNA